MKPLLDNRIQPFDTALRNATGRLGTSSARRTSCPRRQGPRTSGHAPHHADCDRTTFRDQRHPVAPTDPANSALVTRRGTMWKRVDPHPGARVLIRVEVGATHGEFAAGQRNRIGHGGGYCRAGAIYPESLPRIGVMRHPIDCDLRRVRGCTGHPFPIPAVIRFGICLHAEPHRHSGHPGIHEREPDGAVDSE